MGLEKNHSPLHRLISGHGCFLGVTEGFLSDWELARSLDQGTSDPVLHLDHPATTVGCLSGSKESIEVLEPTRVGLSDRIYRTVAGGVL